MNDSKEKLRDQKGLILGDQKGKKIVRPDVREQKSKGGGGKGNKKR